MPRFCGQSALERRAQRSSARLCRSGCDVTARSASCGTPAVLPLTCGALACAWGCVWCCVRGASTVRRVGGDGFRPFLLGKQKCNVHQRNEGLTNEMKAINIQARERTSLIGAYIEIVEIGAR